MSRCFVLHWKDGREDLVKGRDVADAFRRAGFGGGALRALDYWSEVKDKRPHDALLVYAQIRLFGYEAHGWTLVDDPPDTIERLAGGAIMFEPVG